MTFKFVVSKDLWKYFRIINPVISCEENTCCFQEYGLNKISYDCISFILTWMLEVLVIISGWRKVTAQENNKKAKVGWERRVTERCGETGSHVLYVFFLFEFRNIHQRLSGGHKQKAQICADHLKQLHFFSWRSFFYPPPPWHKLNSLDENIKYLRELNVLFLWKTSTFISHPWTSHKRRRETCTSALKYGYPSLVLTHLAGEVYETTATGNLARFFYAINCHCRSSR